MKTHFKKSTIKKRVIDNKDIIKKRVLEKQIKEAKISRNKWKMIFLYLLWLFVLVLIWWLLSVYFVYLQDLPSIKKLWEDVLPESTVIYDKNWGELYNLYTDEKRTYVNYVNISETMRNAIISTEDKTFFENSWFDFKWLVRAWINYIIWKSDKIQWTSTISQQLIKVSFLTNERSIKRKIQELYLSFQLNSNYSKEKILELYLNKISYWSNAYWVEEASKTFFGKSSKDVWVLESSILSSIPKWPTFYSPYNHADRLMWYIYTYKEETSKDIIRVAETENPSFYDPLKNKLKSILTDMDMTKTSTDKVKICKLDKTFFKENIKIDENWCINIDTSKLMELLNSIKIVYDDLQIEKPNEALSWYIMEFNTWRKDFVLWRMLEDNKIKPIDYKQSIIQGLDFKFKKYTENIKYPHFVFFVKEYLEDNFWKEFGSQWWLKIYTTIDPKLQDKAEELVKKQVEINKTKYWAWNAALISIDNRNWHIISMVWWADYFNVAKWSNVNIIISQRQPGSSFKPIIYANAISRKPVWPETPIYDSETKFWWRSPKNYDTKYMWMMPLKKALDYSRNIPAIKMFFFWGWEDVIVKFANSLWIDSIKLWVWYGWPLAIGTGELKPLELATAYSVFANYWKKKTPTPIIRIEDKKWNIIYQSRQSEWVQVFSAAASYIISKIISDSSSRPNQYWNNVLTLKDRKVAAKTGTSNKEIITWKSRSILPWDLWTAWYTPQITTVVWAGNTDWSATKWTCDWLNCAAPIWHDFMEFAHIWLEKIDFKEPEWVYHATISKSSGKLASKATPAEHKVSSIFAVKPYEYDTWGWKSIQIDSLCNWTVTQFTPPDAIRNIFIGWSQNPLIDSFDKSWLKSIWKYSNLDSSDSIDGDLKDWPCTRPSKEYAWISISSNLNNWFKYPIWNKPIDIRFDSNNPIIKVNLSLDWKIIKTFDVDERMNGNLKWDINITDWQHKVTITTLDKYYYTSSISYTINPTWEIIPDDIETDSWSISTWTTNNITSPKISTTNPIEWDNNLQLFQDQMANIRWTINDSQDIETVNVYLNGKLYKILDGSKNFVIPINDTKDFDVWTYSVKIEATNTSWITWIKILEVKIMGK